MFAVINIGKGQYLVSEGDEILVDLLTPSEGEVKFDRVLMLSDEKETLIGKPLISGAKITAKILSTEKGPKIRVSKYKAKSRYRKTIGFRGKYSRIKVMKISH